MKNYIGVFPRDGYFRTIVKVNKKNAFYALFNNEYEAAVAYDDFIRKNNLNRRLNFPDPEPENRIPNTRLIRLTQGQWAIIDEEDFERVNQYVWFAAKRSRTWYAFRNSEKKGIMIGMHNFITNYDKTDHINRNGLHNYKSNLRQCTWYQNIANSGPRSDKRTSIYKGVSVKTKQIRPRAVIHFNKVRYMLGTFNTHEDAARAYDAKAKELFGEFAYLNFPDEHPCRFKL